MKINSIYPVITTDNLEGSRDFYTRILGFEITFDSDWYVSMRTSGDPGFELAIMDHTHESLPKGFRNVSKGGLINLEVDNADTAYERLTSKGVNMILDIRSEDWGQRHFIITDPNGLLIDVIQNIEPSAEFAEQYGLQ